MLELLSLIQAILIPLRNKGYKCVKSLLSYISKKIKCSQNEIYTASTGVIGEFLDPNIIINEIEKNKPQFSNYGMKLQKQL